MVVEHRNYLGCCRSCHFLGCLLHTTTSLTNLDENRKKLPLSVFRYYNGFDYPAYVSLALYPHGYSGQSEPTPMTCRRQFISSIGSFVFQSWLTAFKRILHTGCSTMAATVNDYCQKYKVPSLVLISFRPFDL